MKKVLLSLVCFIAFANIAFAVLPPEVYKERIKNSEIKAIATVEDVKTESWNRGVQTKKVFFKAVNFLTKNTPDNFEGYCYSFKRLFPWDPKEPMVGGTIYYYPKKGDKVLVFVTKNGGMINSYSIIDDELRYEIINNGFENLNIGLKGVYYKDSD